MDASALVLRLLSETGLLGTAMFTLAVLSAWLRVRKVLLAPDGLARPVPPSFKAVAIGLNASLVGVFAAMMFRIPHYYAAEFWSLFALCVAMPALGAVSASVLLQRPHRDA
jgi:O-antigen ligase